MKNYIQHLNEEKQEQLDEAKDYYRINAKGVELLYVLRKEIQSIGNYTAKDLSSNDDFRYDMLPKIKKLLQNLEKEVKKGKNRSDM